MKSLLQISLLLCCLFFISSIFAQGYKTAGGIRLGTEYGITIKQRILDKSAIEGILQKSVLNDKTTMLTVLWEEHRKIIFKKINYYYGAGPHIGFWKSTDNEGNEINKKTVGATAIIGAEITLGRFNISYDFKPAIHLANADRVFNSQTAVSLRYVIKENPRKKLFNRKERKKNKKKKEEKKWWQRK